MDNFIHIIKQNDLKPEDIKKVKTIVMPTRRWKFCQENRRRTPEDLSFDPAYPMACAAYRIDRARWLDPDVRQDPRILEFLNRVEFDIGFDDNAYGLALLKDPSSMLMSAEVLAKGKTFKSESQYQKGSWQPDEFKMTDEELVEKFKDLVSGFLSPTVADKLVDSIFNLEAVGDASKIKGIWEGGA